MAKCQASLCDLQRSNQDCRKWVDTTCINEDWESIRGQEGLPSTCLKLGSAILGWISFSKLVTTWPCFVGVQFCYIGRGNWLSVEIPFGIANYWCLHRESAIFKDWTIGFCFLRWLSLICRTFSATAGSWHHLDSKGYGHCLCMGTCTGDRMQKNLDYSCGHAVWCDLAGKCGCGLWLPVLEISWL